MEVVERIESAILMVAEARGVPLSASCVVHRGELLELLDNARTSFPGDLDRAQQILHEQDFVIENARVQADQIIAHAREEVESMISQTEIVAAAKKEAKRILVQGEEDAVSQQNEIDAYVDSRLATLEVILHKTMDVVNRGRDQLAGVDAKSALSELGDK
jgi:F0F1-type ATP synthase membrane subunit b/b'|tara:strand:+ start:7838 stop:8317 length:480 start_codon:yes stop_codon:yes gene_type:complete